LSERLFKAEVDRAVEIMRAEMIADPGPIAPRLMAFPPAWTQVDRPFIAPIDPNLMAHWQSKNAIGAAIVTILFQAESRVTVFLSDGFGAMSPPAGKTFADMPRYLGDWPPSLIREHLLIFVNALGMKGYAMMLDYTRDGKNRRVFPGPPEPILNIAAARFCYDLTEATEESATLDALNRSRDGKLEAQA